MMRDAFATRLRHFGNLSDDEITIVQGSIGRVRMCGSHQEFVRDGDDVRDIHLLLSGYTCRYTNLQEGRRQITAILVPGDTCDLHGVLLDRIDHNVMTLSECSLGLMSRGVVLDMIDRHPRIARALWRCNVLDMAILREWLVNVGRRSAEQRMAHLFCELAARLDAVGLFRHGSYEFPLTQEELGDALGISTVHVNRTLQDLRSGDLITLKGRTLTILDHDALAKLGEFDPGYLQFMLERPNLGGARPEGVR